MTEKLKARIEMGKKFAREGHARAKLKILVEGRYAPEHPEHDDAVAATHYGYDWETTEEASADSTEAWDRWMEGKALYSPAGDTIRDIPDMDVYNRLMEGQLGGGSDCVAERPQPSKRNRVT